MLPRVVRGCLRWAERAALAAAVLCLAWVFVTWKHAAFYQMYARQQIADMALAGPPPEPIRLAPASTGPTDDALIGMLDAPRVHLSVALVDGDDARTLRLAAGHVPSTPLPWAEGNAAFAAHRDTFFRPLEHLRDGDALVVRTHHGEFRYRVLRRLVVEPGDVWVLDPPGDPVHLTLITCYPFTFLGDAPQRFVVHAARMSAEDEP